MIDLLLAVCALELTIIGMVWSVGHKLGAICTRLNLMDQWQIEATRRFHRIEDDIKLFQEEK